MSCAYWSKTCTKPEDAREHPAFARIQFAGPWHYIAHPDGGVFAYLKDWPAKGESGPGSPALYAAPRACDDGLWYYPPKVIPTIYDLAHGEREGQDIELASGFKVTIPVALLQHRQFRLSGGDLIGPPITEYGRLAAELLDAANATADGLREDDPRVWRLMSLALGQRYRPATPELIDDMRFLAREDIDPLFGLIWWGDPKALSPASDGAGPVSTSSASATAS